MVRNSKVFVNDEGRSFRETAGKIEIVTWYQTTPPVILLAHNLLSEHGVVT